MSQDRPVLVEWSSPVARLTLNRTEKRNALNAALVDALLVALEKADRDDEVRVVTVEGSGPDFCAGADLAELRRMTEAGVMENLADVDRLAALFSAPRRMSKPVVALVRGRALAGGCGLALACDLVLATESATFGFPEARIGFVPAMVTAILRRNLGEKRAFEMLVGGETYAAAEAERMGLVNGVYPDESFDEQAAEFVKSLAERSGSAVALTKRLFHLQDGMDFDAAIRAGADVNVLARMTEDTLHGLEEFLDRGRKGGDRS